MIRTNETQRVQEFERTALPHAGGLLRVAVRLTRGDVAAAEDLVQEALLNAWRSFHQFEIGTNCRAWLFRILVNLSHRRIQKLRLMPITEPAEDIAQTNVVTLFAPPRQATSAEVFEAIDLLPLDQSTVLMLAVVEGLTCKEIASVLGIPIGTVMSRLSRGRVGFRKLLCSTDSIVSRETGNASQTKAVGRN